MCRKGVFQSVCLVIVPVLGLLLFDVAWVAPSAKLAFEKPSLAKPCIIDHAHFDGNAIDCGMTNDGSIVDWRVTGSSGMEWPKGSGKTIDFHSGLWLAGIGHDDGLIHTACVEYSSELVPGPWGSVHTDSVYRIYKINGDGTGDWLEWPVDQGAPVDSVGDPLLLGDQTLFWVCNDGSVAQHSTVFGTPPMGVEIRVTIFGFNRANPLGNTMFIKWACIHQGTQQFDSCFVALWDDPDLGDASDDLVGCDTTLNLGYCYNGYPTDAIYGSAPPAIGFDFFQGPDVPQGSGNYLGMTAFAWYWNGAPDPWDDPQIASEAYWFMKGFAGDGTPYTDHLGNPTRFPLAGDPVTGTGHIDGVAVEPKDRRFLMSSGPFTLAPGDTQVVVGAKVIAQGTDYLDAITALRSADEFAQSAYDNDFQPPLSVELLGFEAASGDGQVTLTWMTAAEFNTYFFNIYRDGEKIASVPAFGEAHKYRYVDRPVANGLTYSYRLSDVDFDGTETVHKIVCTATPAALPLAYSLSQNYPNPFNANTKIRYQIQRAGHVTLMIFNTQGQLVQLLAEGKQMAGEYAARWDGRDGEGREVASGLYFCRLKAGSFAKTIKMVLVR